MKDKKIPTPRTDAAKWQPEHYICLEVVSANFSEKLETELYLANERIKELEQQQMTQLALKNFFDSVVNRIKSIN